MNARIALPTRSTIKLALALLTVYLVWGSTYLAIRVAVTGLPPFLLCGLRYLLASLVMGAIAALAGHSRPTGREWGIAGLVGFFMIGAGNGSVVWAEQFIPSGIVSLLTATLPLWTFLLEGLGAGRVSSRRGLVGILAGFAGVGLLLWPQLASGHHAALWAQALVMLGSLGWAAGMLLGRRLPSPASGLYRSAAQMGGSALGFLVISGAMGEPARVVWSAVPSGVWLATAYLVVFGSCVGFTAFSWLAQHARPSLTATYAYVNPLVAVVLGALVLAEPITGWIGAGTLLIVTSVILVLQGGVAGKATRPEDRIPRLFLAGGRAPRA